MKRCMQSLFVLLLMPLFLQSMDQAPRGPNLKNLPQELKLKILESGVSNLSDQQSRIFIRSMLSLSRSWGSLVQDPAIKIRLETMVPPKIKDHQRLQELYAKIDEFHALLKDFVLKPFNGDDEAFSRSLVVFDDFFKGLTSSQAYYVCNHCNYTNCRDNFLNFDYYKIAMFTFEEYGNSLTRILVHYLIYFHFMNKKNETAAQLTKQIKTFFKKLYIDYGMRKNLHDVVCEIFHCRNGQACRAVDRYMGDLFDFFIRDCGLDVNATNSSEQTVLDFFCESSAGAQFEALRFNDTKSCKELRKFKNILIDRYGARLTHASCSDVVLLRKRIKEEKDRKNEAERRYCREDTIKSMAAALIFSGVVYSGMRFILKRSNKTSLSVGLCAGLVMFILGKNPILLGRH